MRLNGCLQGQERGSRSVAGRQRGDQTLTIIRPAFDFLATISGVRRYVRLAVKEARTKKKELL